MKIQVHTDNHIKGSEKLTAHVESIVEAALEHFGDRITRVEVHLSDEASAGKSRDDDKRCVIEARPASHQPISVSHNAASVEQSLIGAADKLEKSLAKLLDKLDDPRHRARSDAGPTTE